MRLIRWTRADVLALGVGLGAGAALAEPPQFTPAGQFITPRAAPGAIFEPLNQDFSQEDHLDTPRFNRTLWRGLKGDMPYPVRRDGRNLREGRPTLLTAAGAARCG